MLDDWYKKHIHGIEKIIAVCEDFDWSYLDSIYRLSYYRAYHKHNGYSDLTSCLDIIFTLNMTNKLPYQVNIIFYLVSDCEIQIYSDNTPIDLYDFTIYDNKQNGYEFSSRFRIGSYDEDNTIQFYCETFEVVSVNQDSELVVL